MSGFDWSRLYSVDPGGGMLFGPISVIVFVGLVTLFCRVSGYWLIGYVAIGPRLRRAFAMLPGSIAASTAVPVAVDHGWPAIAALLIAFFGMRLIRIEIVVLLMGLGLVAGTRALGLAG